MDVLQQFEALDLATLQRFVDEGREEHLTLEFKNVKSATLKSNDDLRNLATGLSGFANSSGGIIVWGVDARRRAPGEQSVAVALQQIQPIRDLLSRLNELTGQAVSPLIDGVVHKAIHVTADSGYAATYVPASDTGPHMAKLAEARFRYFKRSGDSFYPMEHFDLEDMFGRRRKPVLAVTGKVVAVGEDPRVVIGIVNSGRGTASAPYLAFSVSAPFSRWEFGIDGNGNEGLKRIPFLGIDFPFRYGADTSYVIHPGMEQLVTSVTIPGFGRGKGSIPEAGLTIEYVVASIEAPIQRGRIELSAAELRTGQK